MTDPGEKKIYVDEDWKSKVQAEKEAAKAGDDAPTETAESSAPNETPTPERPDVPLPRPTFVELISMLMTQAILAMGLMPGPDGAKPTVRLHEAKHMIDLIALLEEKTEGNRTDEESRMLQNALHELRMSFVAVQQRAAQS